MLDLFSSMSIDPARIQFAGQLPRRDYLKHYHKVDLSLDTSPYAGHSTRLDSLWMGVPVMTLVGQTSVARAGWSQLSNLGLTELAALDEQNFVRLAVQLARDPARLAQLRSTLRKRMEQSPLMDAARFTRDIESAYRQMWQSWCNEQIAQQKN